MSCTLVAHPLCHAFVEHIQIAVSPSIGRKSEPTAGRQRIAKVEICAAAFVGASREPDWCGLPRGTPFQLDVPSYPPSGMLPRDEGPSGG